MNCDEVQAFNTLAENISSVRQQGISALAGHGINLQSNDSLQDVVLAIQLIGYVKSISIVDNVVTVTNNDGSTNTYTIASSNHTHTKQDITDFPSSLPASDVSAWAKATEKPAYTATEVGADTNGAASTALTTAKAYTDTAISDLINSAPSTLDTLGEIATAMSENQSVVTALNTAIGTKANTSDLTDHTGNTANPHNVTKAQIGLGNVENKSSATIRGELTSDNVISALGYTPVISDTVYGVATTTSNGLMSSTDKTKLDGIASGANKTTVDSALSDTSTNPIQNKVINTALAGKANSTHTHTKAQITDFPTSLPANGGNATTVNSHTVNADVPTGAKFTDTVYEIATQSSNGLMSATDKTKLDGMGSNSTPFVVSSAAPTDTTKFWICDGILKYYNGSQWVACMATMS